MAQLVNLRPPAESSVVLSSGLLVGCQSPNTSNLRWVILQHKFTSNGRFSCLFNNNHKQEQARRALESALGGKKTEFEKWNKEIQKRDKVGGGGNGGRGGWFGGGGWFGWFNDENFWKEAQQASLAVLGIIFAYLVLAKGNLMLAVVFNSLLFVLRGTRNGFAFLTSRVVGNTYRSNSFPSQVVNIEEQTHISAKENVVRKWGAD